MDTNTDKLSNLIQEAKPLYKRKKRQRAVMKACVVMLIPVFMGLSAISLYNAGNNLYLSLENQSLQTELLEDDMGLLR